MVPTPLTSVVAGFESDNPMEHFVPFLNSSAALFHHCRIEVLLSVRTLEEPTTSVRSLVHFIRFPPSSPQRRRMSNRCALHVTYAYKSHLQTRYRRSVENSSIESQWRQIYTKSVPFYQGISNKELQFPLGETISSF